MEKNGIIEQVREEVFPSGKAAEKPLGKYCDHTVLRAYTTRETVKQFCEEAVRCGAASVCVNPVHVAYVHELLRGTGLYTCTVIGFPLGANRSCVKAMEAALAVEDGADEVDMVMNIGALREKDYELVRRDIAGVVAAAAGRAKVKVIIETCYLTEEEKIRLCELVTEAGADYIKTSTGFGTGGATLPDVLLFREHIGPRVKIKASGGIRTEADLRLFLENGCDRLGASAAVTALGD